MKLSAIDANGLALHHGRMVWSRIAAYQQVSEYPRINTVSAKVARQLVLRLFQPQRLTSQIGVFVAVKRREWRNLFEFGVAPLFANFKRRKRGIPALATLPCRGLDVLDANVSNRKECGQDFDHSNFQLPSGFCAGRNAATLSVLALRSIGRFAIAPCPPCIRTCLLRILNPINGVELLIEVGMHLRFDRECFALAARVDPHRDGLQNAARGFNVESNTKYSFAKERCSFARQDPTLCSGSRCGHQGALIGVKNRNKLHQSNWR